mmetsp:Transcript_46213/g.119549  ORF Transcript_46213/g.119549 Transcript_46213/m.119549 type:complete len:219 (-) Transcript_46213:7-663(-)
MHTALPGGAAWRAAAASSVGRPSRPPAAAHHPARYNCLRCFVAVGTGLPPREFHLGLPLYKVWTSPREKTSLISAWRLACADGRFAHYKPGQIMARVAFLRASLFPLFHLTRACGFLHTAEAPRGLRTQAWCYGVTAVDHTPRDDQPLACFGPAGAIFGLDTTAWARFSVAGKRAAASGLPLTARPRAAFSASVVLPGHRRRPPTARESRTAGDIKSR